MSAFVPNAALQIPPDLRRQFWRLERRLWWIDSCIALCGAGGSLVVSYMVLFCSDRFWDTPAWLRFWVACAGAVAALYFAWGWLKHWVWRRRDVRALANLVQRHYRRLGDRLLGIVELADPRALPDNVSPELCRAAIRQVSTEALQFDFRRAVATRKPRLYALTALWLAGLGAIPWLWVPQASWNTFARWIWPGSALPRYTFVSLAEIPSPLIVAHGEPFEIVCAVKFHPFWQPKNASCRLVGRRPIRVPVTGGQVVFPIPGQTQPTELALRIGDVTRQITVEPVLRPALQLLSARIRWPDYLQHPEAERDVSKGAFSFLEGSRVRFEGRTTRELAAATMRWGAAADNTAREETTPLPVQGESFRTTLLPVAAEGQAAFAWQDRWGLTSAAPWLLTLQSHPDRSPEVDCPNQAAAVAVLEEEIFDIQAVARDDYGLRDLAMAWECRSRHETNVVAADIAPLATGAPLTKSLEGTFRFSPVLLKLPTETVVTLRAVAHDYYPDRAPSESASVRVFILSRAEHARLVQQELERLMAELESLTRRQEDLKEAGRALQRAGPDALALTDTDRALSDQAREQATLSDKLRQLSEKASATIREALRNESIPAGLLEEWARHAQTMQTLAGQEMTQAADALSMAWRGAPNRSAALEQALTLEEEILRQLLQLQKEIGPALDRFLANTLVQRLRRIAHTESQISTALQAALPETIGLGTAELHPSHRATIQTLGADQDRTGQESRQLHLEISRFFDRTSETNYGAVAREMQEEEVAQSLADLAALIRNNVGAIAMNRSRHWERQFNAWADLLDQTNLEQAAGAGAPGGSISEAALRRLLALLRLRQQEQNIRDFTGMLHGRKDASRTYREDSILLSIRQSYLIEDTRALEEAGPSLFLPQVQEAMGESEQFLMMPRTDDPVVAAQTDAINLLEAEIMDMLRTAQGSSRAAAMAMLMQMMGLGGPGTGSLAGGSTEQPNDALSGKMQGHSTEERRVEKTSGPSSRVVPAEFREAIQHYHRAVEQFESSHEN